jgi:hypothetical protein
LIDFYTVLKSQQNSIRFILLTGVYKFFLANEFSGLNNLIDLTFNPQYAALFGYTEKEVWENFEPEIKNLGEKLDKNYDETLSVLEENYNGYRIGLTFANGLLSESVYNPFGLACVFDTNDLVEAWYASGDITFLLKKKSEERNVKYLLNTENQNLHIHDLIRSCSPYNLNALSLLYYAGYVTLSSYDKETKIVTLKSPNKEISTYLNSDLLKIYTKTEDSSN